LNLTNQNIEELISLCKLNNQKAQFEVYNRYCKAMYNVAFRIVKDVHFAEDVMQEGFLKAFTKIHDYKQEVAFGAWLKRIIVNYSIDFYKKKQSFSI
jgi:RNA polymerase sigma factor (sigma-70 family)